MLVCVCLLAAGAEFRLLSFRLSVTEEGYRAYLTLPYLTSPPQPSKVRRPLERARASDSK